MSSLVYFFSGLYFSFQRSLVSLIKFIPRHFVVFEAVVNGIDSLTSVSVCSLLVYRKVIDFCLLILYPATLPK
jgi:hypothetical protein